MSARTTIIDRPRKLVGILLQLLRILLYVGRCQMVGDDVLQEVEPEQRKLRQHSSLLRDAGGEHVIERRDPVSCDEEQVIVVDAVNVANFPAGVKLQVGKVGIQENVVTCS